MHRSTPPVLIAVFTFAFAGCQQAPHSLLGPTASASVAGSHLETSVDDRGGALTQGVHHSAANDSGFPCAFPFRFGGADQSHATISDSGNETLHCSGQVAPFAVPTQGAVIFEGFPCLLHYDNAVTTDSRLVLTPSGQASLTCHSKG